MNGVYFAFVTAAFIDGPDARAERVNEAIGGQALAAWLSSALRSDGLEADQPWPEDHGWDFGIRSGERIYLCVCSIEDDPSSTREAHVSLALSRSAWDRLKGRNKLEPADPVAASIERILAAAPDIAELSKDMAS